MRRCLIPLFTLLMASPIAAEEFLVMEIEGGPVVGAVVEFRPDGKDETTYRCFQALMVMGEDGPILAALVESRNGPDRWEGEGQRRGAEGDEMSFEAAGIEGTLEVQAKEGPEELATSGKTTGRVAFAFEVMLLARLQLEAEIGAERPITVVDLDLDARPDRTLVYDGEVDYGEERLHRVREVDGEGQDNTALYFDAEGNVKYLVQNDGAAIFKAVDSETFEEKVCTERAFKDFLRGEESESESPEPGDGPEQPGDAPKPEKGR